jgi:hypothetical protein
VRPSGTVNFKGRVGTFVLGNGGTVKERLSGQGFLYQNSCDQEGEVTGTALT